MNLQANNTSAYNARMTCLLNSDCGTVSNTTTASGALQIKTTSCLNTMLCNYDNECQSKLGNGYYCAGVTCDSKTYYRTCVNTTMCQTNANILLSTSTNGSTQVCPLDCNYEIGCRSNSNCSYYTNTYNKPFCCGMVSMRD